MCQWGRTRRKAADVVWDVTVRHRPQTGDWLEQLFMGDVPGMY